MVNDINYHRLIHALDYYKNLGFEYKHLPWSVDTDVAVMTRPNFSRPLFLHSYSELVGSAEQSFLSYGNEICGAYVGLTPCFRDEWVTERNRAYFMKVELFDNQNVTVARLEEIVKQCCDFFGQFLKVRVDYTEENCCDIVDCHTGTELGSYGIRSHNDYEPGSWIYATGCAEPRLSYVIDLQPRLF